MPTEKKVSEMLIAVSGELLQAVDDQQEMQAHLDLVMTAWNMATESGDKRKQKLKRFISKQKKYAPSTEALKGLEWEVRRIMKQKDLLFPEIHNKVVIAEAIEKGKDDYIIRAYFEAQTGE
jgi:hypothetical protein